MTRVESTLDSLYPSGSNQRQLNDVQDMMTFWHQTGNAEIEARDNGTVVSRPATRVRVTPNVQRNRQPGRPDLTVDDFREWLEQQTQTPGVQVIRQIIGSRGEPNSVPLTVPNAQPEPVPEPPREIEGISVGGPRRRNIVRRQDNS